MPRAATHHVRRIRAGRAESVLQRVQVLALRGQRHLLRPGLRGHLPRLVTDPIAVVVEQVAGALRAGRHPARAAGGALEAHDRPRRARPELAGLARLTEPLVEDLVGGAVAVVVLAVAGDLLDGHTRRRCVWRSIRRGVRRRSVGLRSRVAGPGVSVHWAIRRRTDVRDRAILRGLETPIPIAAGHLGGQLEAASGEHDHPRDAH